MKTLRHSLLLVLCFITVITLSHCSDDGNDDMMEEEFVDLSDPNALTDALAVTGATVVVGTPPAPSTDPAAPSISDPDDAFGVQGGELQLGLDLTSGDASGVYLQIPGADSYFDIPASAFTSGRGVGDEPQFSLALPDNIEPGEFCVDLCVYDAENRVSNIVRVCITVGELGGANSEFLVGIWNVTKIVNVYDGMTETEVIGEEQVETYNESIVCADGQTFEEVEITESETTDFIMLTFSANGALRLQSDGETTYLDYQNSTCEDIQYTTETYSDDWDGAWSYEDGIKRLVLILNAIEDGEEDQEVVDLTISVNGNTMTAVQDYGDGEVDTITLVKQ
ncbi:MAG: hypothetical protein RIM99_17575 [Cyclobacteriaceae bacterium]